MRDLGKWPRMVVAGDPVTEEQADSILIRTMEWWTLPGHDKTWLAQVRAILAEIGMPVVPHRHDFANHEEYLHELFQVWHPAYEQVCERHGFLPYLGLDELANDRILRSFHGWCSWSGVIGTVRHVGKYPGQEEIGDKWGQIAEAFPFLRLTAELTPEDGGRDGAVRYEVAGGKVTWAESGHLPELEPPAAWVAECESVDRLNARGVDPDRLRRALRSVLS